MRIVHFCVFSPVLFACFFALSLNPSGASTIVSESGPRACNPLKNLPNTFIENKGQTHEEVAYYVKGLDKTIFFTASGITITFPGSESDPNTRWSTKLAFLNAQAKSKPQGFEKTKTSFNYFQGKREHWKTAVPSYRKLVYSNLWPGIDLVYSADVGVIKYRFVLRPGADPDLIRLQYSGINSLYFSKNGDLRIETPACTFQDPRPFAYQEVNGLRKEVSSSYVLEENNPEGNFSFGFHLGEFDPSKSLILDPQMFVYCGYIGGDQTDSGQSIAVDSEGCAYVAGYTSSSALTFPVKVGPVLTSDGGINSFVAKVSADGSELVYCGYLGMDSTNQAWGIDVDEFGCAYICGIGPSGAYVSKVSAAGNSLTMCTCLPTLHEAYDIAVDCSGDAYVTGLVDTSSIADTFVIKLSPDLSTLLYDFRISGDGYDRGLAIAVDETEHAYVTGFTSSGNLGTPGSFNPTFNGGYDAFVAKLNSFGTGIIYFGYLGGAGNDYGRGIAVDATCAAYVTGDGGDGLQALVGPDLTYNGGSCDGLVAKINPDGFSLDYCGYIGGESSDEPRDICVNESGNAYITGYTNSSESQGFPVINFQDITYNGETDAFTAKVSADGAYLDYCGYIGGEGKDQGFSIATDNLNNTYIAGYTESEPGDPALSKFPVVTGPCLTYSGSGDAFITKVSEDFYLLVRKGNVNAANGSPFSVLKINGSTGDVNRVYTIKKGNLITMTISTAPFGPSPSNFTLYLVLFEPTQGHVSVLPYGIGYTCFAFPLTKGMVTPPPFTIVNNIGFRNVLGHPLLDPMPPAPCTVFETRLLPKGTYTFQGNIYDLGSLGPNFSVTNAIVLKVI